MSDTGWVSPGTVVSDDAVGTVAWSNPSNAKASDDSYAVCSVLDYFGSITDKVVKLVDETGSIVGDNNADTNTSWSHYDTTASYGGSDDLWNVTWTDTDINDSDFGVVLQATVSNDSEYLKATNFDFSIPSGSTIDGIEVQIEKKFSDQALFNAYVDHIQIKVYYTETGTPTVGTKYPLPTFKRP
jgi:hypothetical protein